MGETKMPPAANNETTVCKILTLEQWQEACRLGNFAGSSDDVRDGFIHLSTLRQLQGTAEKHFYGVQNLMIAGFRAGSLGEALLWEPSRGGEAFPHLYAPLPAALALWTRPLPMSDKGEPMIPSDLA